MRVVSSGPFVFHDLGKHPLRLPPTLDLRNYVRKTKIKLIAGNKTDLLVDWVVINNSSIPSSSPFAYISYIILIYTSYDAGLLQTVNPSPTPYPSPPPHILCINYSIYYLYMHPMMLGWNRHFFHFLQI